MASHVTTLGEQPLFSLPRFDARSNKIQSNFNGSNIFGTIEICSKHGLFEPLRVNHGTSSGNKLR